MAWAATTVLSVRRTELKMKLCQLLLVLQFVPLIGFGCRPPESGSPAPAQVQATAEE